MEHDNYVTVDSAAQRSGISARTIRYWIASGKLTATAVKRGKRVRMGDVEQLATLTGRVTGSETIPTATETTSAVAGGQSLPQLVTDAARQQLDLIRDEWLQPLIQQLRQLEHDNGRLEAEREQLHDEVSMSQTEATNQHRRTVELEAERDTLRSRVRALEAEQTEWRVSDPDAAPEAARRAWWQFWRP